MKQPRAGAPPMGRAGALVLGGMVVALAAGGCGQRGPAVRLVEIRGFAFVPDTIDAAPGDTIVWSNRDIVPHTVTAVDTSWDSGNLEPGAGWRTVVAASGERRYTCRFHPTMLGAIRVRD